GGGVLAYADYNPFQGLITVSSDNNEGPKKKVVVLGTRWAGTSFLKNLKSSSYDVQNVSPRNYFAFTPLLPSVTNGTVEARSIVEPIRNIVRKKHYNVDFKEAECYKIDLEVDDAQKLHRSIIDCYERANIPTVSEEERKRIMRFVVVGGGPTGVEYAAELHDLAFDDFSKLYPAVKDYLKITLLEAGDHILNMFDKRITEYATEKFQRDGI
ncbi:hypothetical protein Tsubulata_022814, partial [Turnera subulata]